MNNRDFKLICVVLCLVILGIVYLDMRLQDIELRVYGPIIPYKEWERYK